MQLVVLKLQHLASCIVSVHRLTYYWVTTYILYTSRFQNLNYIFKDLCRINIAIFCIAWYHFLRKIHTVWPSKIDHRPRNMLLIKNPQFLPNFYDTLSKCPTHELVILAKCHKNWVKIVDFFINSIFLGRWSILLDHTVGEDYYCCKILPPPPLKGVKLL